MSFDTKCKQAGQLQQENIKQQQQQQQQHLLASRALRLENKLTDTSQENGYQKSQGRPGVVLSGAMKESYGLALRNILRIEAWTGSAVEGGLRVDQLVQQTALTMPEGLASFPPPLLIIGKQA